MAIASSIALACLLAGADAFGSTPKPGPATCDGHTGNLAVLAAVGSSCDNIAHGYKNNSFSCENEDGSDGTANLAPGVDIVLKEVCPEKCGHHPGSIPCGHAPKVDTDAVGAAYGQPNCAALRDGGLCESEMLANWFCGESCRGGAPWDECMWHKSARQQIDDDCADEAFLATYGYTETEACEADSVANYIADSTGTCPGDTSGTGADCYNDQNLFNAGSTQVAQCPGDPFRRRKLTRSGTHSDAMKTKGVFTLTASGSK